jgi:hypothetical protein
MKRALILLLLGLFVLLGGCATVEELSTFGMAPSYPNAETEKVCTNSWRGRLDWEDGGGFERYDAEIDFAYDGMADKIEATFVFTLQEASGQSKLVGKEGGVAVWELEGPLSTTTRSLKLEEVRKEDPNEFFSAWMQKATLTFDPDWSSFNGTVYQSNGNQYRGVELLGRMR